MKYAGLLVIWLLTIPGCERPFLEPWPPDGARTPKEIWSFYDFARGILWYPIGDNMYSYLLYSMTGPAMLASACDEAEHTEPMATIQSINDGSWSPSRSVDSRYGGSYTNSVRSPWYNSYLGMRKVNIFLQNLDTSPIINDPSNPLRANEKDILKGTALFLRAFLKFELFRAYGTYVILDRPLNLDEELKLPRSTMQECYQSIIDDLDEAIPLLPYIHIDPNWYLPTRTNAQLQKTVTQLYYASPLFQGEDRETYPYGLEKNTVGDVDRWLDVVESARPTIQENTFHNLMTISTYSRPFAHNVSGCYLYRLTATNYPDQVETILGTSRRSLSDHSYYNQRYSIPDGEEGGSGLTNPTQDMVDAYEVVSLQSSGKPVVGAEAVPFDWSNPTHAANPYANRDPRFYFTISYNGTLWGTSTSYRYYIDTYETVAPYAPAKHRDYSRPNHTKTGYYYRKWISESFMQYISGHYTNYNYITPFYRFAELLLIYAEAMNEAYGPDVVDPDGPLRAINVVGSTTRTPSTAREALNCVRERVGMPPVPAGLTQDEFREKLKHERRIELAFEDKRFWDLRRWKMGDVFDAPIHGIKITPTAWNTSDPPRPTAFTYEKVQVEDRFWNDRMYWHPIPYQELVKYEGVIKQNPGW